MADLKITNFNMNSDKYIFKKKLSLRRKSKRSLFYEAGFMFFFSLFLFYINYLIPNKNLLIQSIPSNLNKSFMLIIELCLNIYEIFLVIFIFSSLLITFILLIGSLYRIFRIVNRKTKLISYK